jgi:ParB family transcriptional regulator, chromosome partitioning protein
MTNGLYLIPLNQLYPSPTYNVRKSGGLSIDELAESIARQELIHNLTVVQIEGGKKPRYEVSAGGRRLRALKLLAKNKRIPANKEIACKVISADKATAVSLTENMHREAMHPADEFEAMAKLVDEGMDEADIAAEYGVSVSTVRRRLLLARVSPKVLDAYRNEKLELDHVMAMTLTSNHEQQEAFLALRHIPQAWQIRDQLSAETVPGSDRRARYVGEKAYTKAGGAVRADLFGRGDEHGTLLFEDSGLLERLALAKLEKIADKLQDEWAWVETRTSFDHSERSAYTTAPTIKRADTPEEAALRADLIARDKALQVRMREIENSGDDSEEMDAEWTKVSEEADTVTEQLEQLDEAQLEPHPDGVAITGAVVYLDSTGKPQRITGLVRPADKAQATRLTKTAQSTASNLAGGNEGEGSADANEQDPSNIRGELTALRTSVLQDAIARNVPVALRLLAYQLVQSLDHRAEGRNVYIRTEDKREAPAGIDRSIADSATGKANAARAQKWQEVLPENDEELFAWCLAADDATVSELLAYCTASCYDDIARWSESKDAHGPATLRLLGVDMADHYRPTAANYFGRVKKSVTLAAIEGEAVEGLSAETLASLGKQKRAELAQEAEQRVTPTRWLPATLRS